MKIVALVAASAIAMSGFSANAQLNAQPTVSFSQSERILERELRIKSALVKSKEDVIALTQRDPGYPLNNLSKEDFEEFTQSLTFNEKGLTGLSPDVLRRNLTPTEIYQVLYPMGFGHLAFQIRSDKIVTSSDLAIYQQAMRTDAIENFVSTKTLSMLNEIGDHQNYYCRERGTCAYDGSSICTSNC